MQYKLLAADIAEERSVKLLEQYITKKNKKLGQDITLTDVSNHNIEYDYITSNSPAQTIELKTRRYDDDNLKYLTPRDILIEAIQSLPDVAVSASILDPYKLHTAIGWMYKCNADRLIQISFLGDQPYDILDIDWRQLKLWINEHSRSLGRLVISDITTGSLNYSVKIKNIEDITIWTRSQLCNNIEQEYYYKAKIEIEKLYQIIG